MAEPQDRIELFYFPSYSPELNPEGRRNAGLKQAIGSRVPARTKTKLKAATIEHMTELEKSPEHVKNYIKNCQCEIGNMQIFDSAYEDIPVVIEVFSERIRSLNRSLQ